MPVFPSFRATIPPWVHVTESSTITVSSREAGDPDRFVDHFAPAHNVVTSKASPVTLFWYRIEITGL